MLLCLRCVWGWANHIGGYGLVSDFDPVGALNSRSVGRSPRPNLVLWARAGVMKSWIVANHAGARTSASLSQVPRRRPPHQPLLQSPSHLRVRLPVPPLRSVVSGMSHVAEPAKLGRGWKRSSATLRKGPIREIAWKRLLNSVRLGHTGWGFGERLGAGGAMDPLRTLSPSTYSRENRRRWHSCSSNPNLKRPVLSRRRALPLPQHLRRHKTPRRHRHQRRHRSRRRCRRQDRRRRQQGPMQRPQPGPFPSPSLLPMTLSTPGPTLALAPTPAPDRTVRPTHAPMLETTPVQTPGPTGAFVANRCGNAKSLMPSPSHGVTSPCNMRLDTPSFSWGPPIPNSAIGHHNGRLHVKLATHGTSPAASLCGP